MYIVRRAKDQYVCMYVCMNTKRVGIYTPQFAVYRAPHRIYRVVGFSSVFTDRVRYKTDFCSMFTIMFETYK